MSNVIAVLRWEPEPPKTLGMNLRGAGVEYDQLGNTRKIVITRPQNPKFVKEGSNVEDPSDRCTRDVGRKFEHLGG